METNMTEWTRKGFVAVVAAMLASVNLGAETIEIQKFRYAGPYPVKIPWMADSVNVKAEPFSMASVLDSPLSIGLLAHGKVISHPGSEVQDALHLVSFTLRNTSREKVVIAVDGMKNFRLYVDGSPLAANGGRAETTLMPSVHTVIVKYLTARAPSSAEKSDRMKVTVTTADGKPVEILEPDADIKRSYNLYDVICAAGYPDVSLSPDGRFMIVRKTWVDNHGGNHSQHEVRNVQTDRVTAVLDEQVRWMPRTNKMYFTRNGETDDEGCAAGQRQLVTIDPLTMEREVMASGIPSGDFRFLPDEKGLVYTVVTEGRKKDAEVYDVKAPDDRQPGWRSRSNLALYDLASGILQPLTFGYHNVYLEDISADSRYLLIGKNEERLTQRPTTLTSVYRLDLNTLRADTLVDKGAFVGSALFAPDGGSVLFTGSPEAFDGIGSNVEQGQTPSMIDTQLYLMTIADRKVRPLTHDFNPNVLNVVWSEADGNVYFTAEDKDCVHLFRLEPKTGAIRRIDTPEEYIKSFSLASRSPMMAFTGQSASNADRLYKMSTKTPNRSQLVDDLSARELKDVELGECKAWNFVNSRGDTLCCRYYLPPHFDAGRNYPMVVNYYGGCSPTSRTFQSRYPHHLYAAMGYVVLVVNPSGATGFGQKFSARHVDTAGKGVAEDIISATQAFCDQHAFVNRKKIGCIGASYGGFMTQYLQTKTDLFAAAISHAGISDHTSYWGEGYWGYSYSEVSMANEYPWTDKRLYVDQSPLYNADKIHTPLLFLHGTADNNVPVGESIQLYTALKLLGRPTAMVLVEGQDHHIIDFKKRIKWQSTIFAWFARWLQDDDSWWKEMYGDEKM